jgi:hypothetical protein
MYDVRLSRVFTTLLFASNVSNKVGTLNNVFDFHSLAVETHSPYLILYILAHTSSQIVVAITIIFIFNW